MKKILTMSVREMYAMILIVLMLLFSLVYTSMALFEKTIEKVGIASIIASEINFTLTSDESGFIVNGNSGIITVPAGETKTFDINISNSVSNSVRYKTYYRFENDITILDVNVGLSNTSQSQNTDLIGVGLSKTVSVTIENNATQSATIEIGVQGGYATNATVVLDMGRNELEIIEESIINTCEVETGSALTCATLVNNFQTTSLEPIEREDILTNAAKKTFTVTNTSNEKVFVHISMEDMVLPEAIKRYDFMWSLYEEDKNVSNGTFADATGTSLEVGPYQVFEVGETKTYNLYVWIDKTGLDQSSLLGQTFDAVIKTTSETYQTTPESEFTFSNGTITEYTGSGGDVIIPETIGGVTVTSIGANAFEYSQLTSIVLPNTITEIGRAAFYENNLKTIVIPNGVTTININTFASNELTSVSIPNGVTYIDTNAFQANSLSNIVIPNSITEIQVYAFQVNNLTNVIIPDSVLRIYTTTFDSSVNTILRGNTQILSGGSGSGGAD